MACVILTENVSRYIMGPRLNSVGVAYSETWRSAHVRKLIPKGEQVSVGVVVIYNWITCITAHCTIAIKCSSKIKLAAHVAYKIGQNWCRPITHRWYIHWLSLKVVMCRSRSHDRFKAQAANIVCKRTYYLHPGLEWSDLSIPLLVVLI